MSCDQTLYIKLMGHLIEELSKAPPTGGATQNTRTYIQVKLLVKSRTDEWVELDLLTQVI